jgi:hypothetical protein
LIDLFSKILIFKRFCFTMQKERIRLDQWFSTFFLCLSHFLDPHLDQEKFE